MRAAAMTTTYPAQSQPGMVVEADIELNGVNFEWSGAHRQAAPLAPVLTHEIGHVLGFPDVCRDEPCPDYERTSIMRSGTTRTTLTAWDVERLCAAFPR
jgi:hypothetical protein